MLAIELCPEETCRPLQYFVGAFHFPQFLFKSTNFSSRIRGDPFTFAFINVGPGYSGPHGLGPITQLGCHALHGPLIRPQLSAQRPHHPSRCSFFLRRISPATLVVFVHDSILVSKV